MPKLTKETVEKILLQVAQKLDKRVQILAVNETKDGDGYRVTVVKDGKTGTAAIRKDVIEAFVAGGEKTHELRKALGRAVSHLSIKYRT
jgi:hypothetical protein